MFKHYPDGNEFVLQQDQNNVILFEGYNDVLRFLQPNDETIITVGQNQTLGLSKVGDGNTVLDMGQGLPLDLRAPEFGAVQIFGFGHDRSGSVLIATPGVTVTPDGHGGTLLSFVFGGGGTFDFIGDNHLSMAQIHTT